MDGLNIVIGLARHPDPAVACPGIYGPKTQSFRS